MSATRLNDQLTKLHKDYGALFSLGWKLILCPFVALVLYSAQAYLRQNYVDRVYFDSAIGTLRVEQKAMGKELGEKLDHLLIQSAIVNQKFSDAERRMGAVESRIDRLEQARD